MRSRINTVPKNRFKLCVQIYGEYMRIKTSMYIEESIDDRITDRATLKKTSRSNVVERDLENLLLCIEIGKHEIERQLNRDEVGTIISQLCKLSGDKTTTLFISMGTVENWKGNKSLQDKIRQLSPLARLSLIDMSEEK